MFNITFIFDRYRRSWAAAIPVKYGRDSNNLSGTFARSKILLTEKLTNGALVTPTPGPLWGKAPVTGGCQPQRAMPWCGSWGFLLLARINVRVAGDWRYHDDITVMCKTFPTKTPDVLFGKRNNMSGVVLGNNVCHTLILLWLRLCHCRFPLVLIIYI